MSVNVQTFGTVGGSPISGDVPAGRAGLTALKRVTLTANYARSPPPNFPRPDPGAPLPSVYVGPQMILSGATLTLFACEADALVTAGAATYA